MVRGSNSGGARFSTRPDRPCGQPNLVYNGYRVFPRGKVWPGRAADHSPLLVPWSWKSRAIPLPTLWATTGPVTATLYPPTSTILPLLYYLQMMLVITEKNYENPNWKIRLTLDCSSMWFKANQLVLNLMKMDIIKSCPSHFLQSQLITEHNNSTVSEIPDTKILGMQIDSHLNCKCRIDQILSKLSTAGFVIRQLFHVLNLKTLQMTHFAYFHSVIRYGIIFWGNAGNSCKVFKLQLCLEQNQEHLVEVCSGNLKSYLFLVNLYCLWWCLL